MLAVAFICFGLALLCHIFVLGESVGWDLTQGVERGRLTGTAPAWSSMLIEAILGPVFLMLGVAAARGAR